MEYYDYKEIGNAIKNSNSTTSTPDEKIVLIIGSSIGGILILIIICCCCSACLSGWVDNCINNSLRDSDAVYGERVLQRMEKEKEKNMEDPDVRKKRLLKSFERNKVSMVVTKCSFVGLQHLQKSPSDEALTESSSTTSSKSDNQEQENEDVSKAINVASVLAHDIESGEPNEIILHTSSSTSEQCKIPNCCAICLCSYDVNDTVIWSCNKECSHAFHDECILPWLVKNQNGECPCCRRNFTDLVAPGANGLNIRDSPSFLSIRSWFVRLRYTFLSGRENE